MTGQVKEEILTRFGELGLRVHEGCLHFEPSLLSAHEFGSAGNSFCFLDVDGNWQTMNLADSSLAFTCCQVPVVYHLCDRHNAGICVMQSDGQEFTQNDHHLSEELSREVFSRTGMIRQIRVGLDPEKLFKLVE